MANLSERVGSLFERSQDATWDGDVSELLYDGETVEREVSFSDGEVVVTSHRLLVFTPDGGGSNFRQVDRPNVVGVGIGHVGESNLLERTMKWGIMGLVLAAAGQVVDLSGLVSDISFGSAAGRVGLGPILGMINKLLALIANLDRILTMLGALLILLAMVALGAYLLTRDRVLEIELAGQEDVQIEVSGDVGDETVAEITAALTGSPREGPRPDAGDDGTGGADGSLKSDDPLGSPDGPDGGA